MLVSDRSYLPPGLLEEVEAYELVTETSPALMGSLFVNKLLRDLRASWFWKKVYVELQSIKTLYTRFQDSINIGEALPPKYDAALAKVEKELLLGMHKHTLHLAVTIPQRPGFKYAYTFEEAGDCFFHDRKDSNPATLFTNDPLDWCLEQLQGDPDSQDRLDYGMLFQFLDDHLHTTTEKCKGF